MRILITGATGYIGRRLKRRLLQEGDLQIRVFVKKGESISSLSTVEVFEGSSFDKQSLDAALCGVDVAFYLIHSMESRNYRELDRISAQNFLDSCKKNGVKKIVYLGGLGEKESASEHLLSRIETGEILSSSGEDVKCIWFRAGVIIGSGSASFEIIRNLVEKLPFMIAPKWVRTLCQPIAERDVIEYLVASLRIDTDRSLVVDIGSEVMSYADLLMGYADVVGLKRVLLPIPFFSPKLSSYWLTLMTPVPLSVASALVEGLKSEVVVKNSAAKEYFPHIVPMSFKEAVLNAVNEIKNSQVISRWSDASGEAFEFDHSSIADAVFVDRQRVPLGDKSPDLVFASVRKIGGDNGWYGYDWLWKLRGALDKLFGGYGLSRGRRDKNELRVGDSVDFWKVVDIKEGERLLLFAQMRLPGSAWLEWVVKDGYLIQSAYFYPHGLFGRFYWYVMLPFHFFIFKAMAKNIVKSS